MEEIYRHLGETNLWESSEFAKAASKLTVTEIWHSTKTGSQVTIHREVQVDFLPQQLFDYKFEMQGHPRDCVLRVIYADYSPSEWKSNLPQPALSHILDTFKLSLAFDFFTSSFANVSCLPNPTPSVQTYSLSYHPKLALIWSHDNSSTNDPLTNAVCFVSPERRDALKRLLERPWGLETHPMLLPFMCTLLLSSEIDDWQQKVKQRVRKVEVRTGHYQFRTRTEKPTAQELGEILAQLNGHTTRLASLVRKLRMIDALNEFVIENVHPKEHRGTESTRSAQAPKDTVLLRHNVSLIQRRAKMQEVENLYTMERVKIQTSAVSNPPNNISPLGRN
jgi:hypothetical protein